MSYTFGDTDEASARLRKLAEVYEPETRALLQAARTLYGSRAVSLAVDLGSGPGWSTALLHSVIRPERTIGLEASARYVAEARANQWHLEFFEHNVLQHPFPVGGADFLFCRFLLTHLSSPAAALMAWSAMAAPGAFLVIHETEKLETSDPVLSRYYEMVAEMQRHYGQELNVGAILDGCFEASNWNAVHAKSIRLEKPARVMAGLHLPNLRTWGKNEFAARAFDPGEVASLESALGRIASGLQRAASVRNTARQIVARHRGD